MAEGSTLVKSSRIVPLLRNGELLVSVFVMVNLNRIHWGKRISHVDRLLLAVVIVLELGWLLLEALGRLWRHAGSTVASKGVASFRMV